MVRLKVVLAFLDNRQELISIPYGAIKSDEVGFKFKEEIVISIPYGAIKRYISMNTNKQVNNFNSLWCD